MTAVPGKDGSDISQQAGPAPGASPALSAPTDATEGGLSPVRSTTPGAEAAVESGKTDGSGSAVGAGAGDDAAAGESAKDSPPRRHQGEGDDERGQQSGGWDGDNTGGDAPSVAAATAGAAAAADSSCPVGGEGRPPSATDPVAVAKTAPPAPPAPPPATKAAAAAVGDGRVEPSVQAEASAMTTVGTDGSKTEDGEGDLAGARPPSIEGEELASQENEGEQ